ncbi:V-type ATP synthase subunit D [Streptomyces lasalocidi]
MTPWPTRCPRRRDGPWLPGLRPATTYHVRTAQAAHGRPITGWARGPRGRACAQTVTSRTYTIFQAGPLRGPAAALSGPWSSGLRAGLGGAGGWERLVEADGWLVRGSLLGGEGALGEAAPVDRTRVDIGWATLMGVRHPATVSWTDPVRSPGERTPPNTALAHAAAACRAAVQAAAQYAAHQAAAELLAAEAARTRQRVRALRRLLDPTAAWGTPGRGTGSGRGRARGRGQASLGRFAPRRTMTAGAAMTATGPSGPPDEGVLVSRRAGSPRAWPRASGRPDPR